jgi:GNAT superfamily N-acetyltransferase
VDAIFRDAFRAYLNVPDSMIPDASVAGTRARADLGLALGAEVEGRLVGSVFAARWGSVAKFGPTTVRSTGWTGSAGQVLMEAALERASAWGPRLRVGYTFSNSVRHVEFYQRLGFRTGHLEGHLGRQVKPTPADPDVVRLSAVPVPERAAWMDRARALSGAVYEGLDVQVELEAVLSLGLGEVVALTEGSTLVGLAICHLGPNTEAGTGVCCLKWAAVLPGASAEARLIRLVTACEHLAAEHKLTRLSVAINLRRRPAYQALLRNGFILLMLGIALHVEEDDGLSNDGVWLLDDWR